MSFKIAVYPHMINSPNKFTRPPCYFQTIDPDECAKAVRFGA
jgi:hypothetical protein